MKIYVLVGFHGDRFYKSYYETYSLYKGDTIPLLLSTCSFCILTDDRNVGGKDLKAGYKDSTPTAGLWDE
jgi:hypothetical protein